MSTGLVTNTRGRLVPLTNTIKRTKQLSLVKTTDITAAVIGGAALGSYAVARCVAIFYADSVGNWRALVNCTINNCTASARTSIRIDFLNLLFKSGHPDQAVAVKIDDNTTNIGGGAFAIASSTAIYVNHASVSSVQYNVAFDVELNAEPTTYTTSGNMEVVSDVTAYIPDASASNAGLMGLTAQSFIGIKNFQDGIKLGNNETIVMYDEVALSANMSGVVETRTITGHAIKIGNIVSVVMDSFSVVTASSTGITIPSWLPSGFIPAGQTRFIVQVYISESGAAGAYVPICIAVHSNGTIEFFDGTGAQAWNPTPTADTLQNPTAMAFQFPVL